MAGIAIPVGAKADDRSFRQIGEQAERFFRTVGKDSASAFTQDFAAAVNQSSPQVQKSFDKIRDSIGQVTVAQAKLSELQNKGAGEAQLIAQSERLEKARRAETRAISEARVAYDGLARSGGAVQSALQGLVTGAVTRNTFLDPSHVDAASAALGGISTKALAAATGVAALGTAAVVVGKQFYDLGAQWDDITDSMTVRTGKVGDQLKSLTDVVGAVGSTTAAPLGSIGEIVGQISQSMPGVAANSDAMRQMASNLAYLSENGQAVDVRSLGQAFSAFNINPAESVKALDELTRASQSTGIPLNELVNSVQRGAPQFKQFGLDIGQSTAVLASFEQGGLDSGSALTGLRTALGKLNGDARGSQQALADVVTQIKQLHDSGQEGAAKDLARDTFGARNFAPFLDAIENGRVSVDAFNKSVKETGPSVQEMQDQTDDGAQGLQKFGNTLKTTLKPVADTVFGTLNMNMQFLTGNFSELTTASDKLAEHLKDLDSVPITPDSALGRLLLPGGGLPGTPGTPAPTAPPSVGTGALGQNPDTGAPPTTFAWGKAPDFNKKPTAPKLPDAPQLPYDTSLPQGFSQLPQTSAIVGAEQGWMDARHTLAEKQARVDQLQKDSNATQDDITKARNDVINAQQAQNQAQLRLYDAQASLYDKSNKQARKQSSDAGEIGAKLDDDLGISKGLSGIADNLTRFIANLAAAPLLGQLSAISEASPSKGGFGLLGMMGAQGAFGPKFTGIDDSQDTDTGSSKQVAVLQPGGSVGYTTTGSSSGAPYGLPGGTNTGGYGTGTSQTFPPWVMALANAFNVKPSTYSGHQETDRHEAGYAPNPTHENRGIDWSGAPQDMQRFADYLKTVPGMEQVIWNGGGIGTGDTVEIAGGRPQPGYFAGDLAGHGNHVHTRQSQAIPLPGGASPAGDSSGTPSVFSAASSAGTGSFPIPLPVTIVGGAIPIGGGGGGGGAPIGSAASGQGLGPAPGPAGGGLSPDQWNKIAGAEASGNWSINSGNGYSGGLQFDPNTWTSNGGGQYAPQAWQATPDQQMDIGNRVLASQGPGAWPATSQAHPDWFQGGAPTGGQPGGQPGASPGGPAGFPTGVAPPVGSGSGIGITPGGSLDSAMGMAASAFPGIGQAAQTGIKEANRAIQYAGQVAGIGVEGLMQTFIPGESQLANNSWFTKILGGIAGAKPALPNVAGSQAAQQSAVDPNSTQHGQAGGAAPGPTNNITVNNQRATEDGTGRDVAAHLTAMYQGPSR